jgi:hypothetical protein
MHVTPYTHNPSLTRATAEVRAFMVALFINVLSVVLFLISNLLPLPGPLDAGFGFTIVAPFPFVALLVTGFTVGRIRTLHPTMTAILLLTALLPALVIWVFFFGLIP